MKAATTESLSAGQIAVLTLLRDAGPQRLAQLNEAAIDECFRARPRLVMIHTSHPDNPLMDITSIGMQRLAAAETA
jgi:hypothetical protein